MIRLTLPYPPTTNKAWRAVQGRVILSKDARRFKKDVATLGLVNRVKPIDGNVALTMRVYRPKRIGDLMNREKITLDALQGVAYHDDSQIVEAHFSLHDDKHNPRVEIEVVSVEHRLF